MKSLCSLRLEVCPPVPRGVTAASSRFCRLLDVFAAKIRADATIKTAQSRDAATVEKSKLDTDRDTQYQNSLNRRAEIQADSDAAELAQRKELEIYKENNSLKKELDKIKAHLAEVTMELTTQKELAHASNNAKQVAETDMEPVGRAPAGEAFQK